MSLMITNLVTRCQVPRRASGAKHLAERIVRVAREGFAAECSRQLAARWTASGRVIRIRRLPVQLRLESDRLDDERLARAWAEAFIRALFTSLAYPTGVGPVEIVRAENRAEWLARFIADLLAGNAEGRWEYEEFNACFGLDPVGAVLTLLSEEPAQAAPALLALEEQGALDRLLSRSNELALERLFVIVSNGLGATQERLSLDDLLAVGRYLIGQVALEAGSDQALRRHALRLFLAMSREPGVLARGRWTPRRVWHALMSLKALVEGAVLLTSNDLKALVEGAGSSTLNEWESALATDSLERSGIRLHPVVAEMIAALRAALSTQPRRLTELANLLVQIEALIPASDRSIRNARWAPSDCAGVWLLAGLLDRQGWPQSLLQSSLGASYGPSAITYGLAALALAVLNRFDPEVRGLDPGLALFAGWFEEPDLAGLRRFLAEGSPDARRQLLTAIAGTEAADDQAVTWEAAFDWLAERIIRDFAIRVRGFRQASRKFVVKSFLAVPGNIRVEEKRILVRLESNPFHVALRISSMDEPLEAVSWLGGRRLEFQLEGL
jgi:hypothetical protein